MAYARGPWQLARASLARAPRACAAAARQISDRRIVIGSILYYTNAMSNAQNPSFRHACRVPRLTFLDAQGVPRHCHRTLGGGILPE